MNSGEDTSSQELVIIRQRSGGEPEAHKGGIWKIAYADFMTAMMAFFLVMWLINATDKKTLTQVATYFNPLRLNDRVPSIRGLHGIDSGAQGKEDQPGNSKEPDGKAKKDAKTEKYTDEALFKDPYGVLSRLAVQAMKEDRPRSPAAANKDGEAMLLKGEAYRDPFDPAFRQETVAKNTAGKDTAKEAATAKDAAAKDAAPDHDIAAGKDTPVARSADPTAAARAQSAAEPSPVKTLTRHPRWPSRYAPAKTMPSRPC